MNKNSNNYKVIVLIVCIAASILGVYMTFFHKKSSEKKEEMKIEKEETMGMADTMASFTEDGNDSEQIYANLTQKFPDTYESMDETYNGGKIPVEVYFTNTRKLDESLLPWEAQAILASEVQTFLTHRGYEDVTELYVDEESFEEDKDHIVFECYMDGYEEKLQIEYLVEESLLKYHILE